MAQQRTKTVTAKQPAEKVAEHSAQQPAVALVHEESAEPKRRGRPPGAAAKTTTATATATAKRGRKGVSILFMVETAPDSALFEIQPTMDIAELMELGDAGRRVVATRKWREF